MAKQVNYEVQVMQDGRWTIHARYPATGNADAIEEAKEIAISRIGDVRVLRDVYDSDTGMSNEFKVYFSKMNKSGASGRGDDDWNDDWGGDDHDDWGDWGGGSDDGGDWGEDDDFYSPDELDKEARKEAKRLRKEKKRRKRAREKGGLTSLSALIVKLLLITLLSLGVAAASIPFASAILDNVSLFGIRMVGPAKDNALIMLFLGVFVALALILSSVLFANTSLETRARRPAPARRAAPGVAARPAAVPTADMTPQDPSGYAQGLRDALDFDTDDEGGQKDAEKPADSGDDKPHENIEEATAEGKQKAYMMKFTNSALQEIGQDKEAMSSFDKFGVSLFLAGACETVTQKSGMADDIKERMMADSLQAMGFKEDHAKSFARRYEEYLVQDSKYMQMFQAGRNSMNHYFTDESRIEKNMSVAMDEWHKPKTKEEQTGPITVLFTDIADSTAMTQKLGDAGAQYVVHVHNRIVREALTMWHGREVKHTGDGIMASFAKTSDSLDAAMQMQREASAYTADNQDKPLFLKIGINSGEAIAEDNDLFGSTVQMSSRIADRAQKEEILISSVVYGICDGAGYKFKNRGSYPIKGFETDPVLYEVLWRE